MQSIYITDHYEAAFCPWEQHCVEAVYCDNQYRPL